MVDAGFGFQLLDLVGHQPGVAGAISPALDVAVSAVDALVDAAALGLDGDGGSVALIAGEIDPAIQAWRRQRVQICVFTWRSENHSAVSVPDEARHRLDRFTRNERRDQRDARSLSVTCHGVIHGEITEQSFWRHSESGAARHDFRLRRR